MSRPSDYAHAAFALGWAEQTSEAPGVRARAAHQAALEAADTAPHPTLIRHVLEAGRKEGRRQALAARHQQVYDQRKAALLAIIALLVKRFDVKAVAAAAAALAAQQAALNATPVQRRRTVTDAVHADLRKTLAGDSDLRDQWAAEVADGYTDAAAEGDAEAQASTGHGPADPKKVAALLAAARLAVPRAAAEQAAVDWVSGQLWTVAMGAALAAGDGADLSAATHKTMAALTDGSRAAKRYEDDLHRTLFRTYLRTLQASQPTAAVDFITMGDGKVCPACWEAEGENPWDPASVPVPPTHPTCFPAGTLVSGPTVEAATQRWYSGELVEIETARGHVLAGTPNHPVLTLAGWRPLGTLHEGGDVICGSLDERRGLRHPDDAQVPTRIEQVAETLRRSGPVSTASMPVAPEDFHGDGADGQVDVVWADGLLRGDCQTSSGQPAFQSHLDSADVAQVAFSGTGKLAQSLGRDGTPEDRRMRGLSVSPVLVSGPSAHHQSVRRQDVPSDRASLSQSLFDGAPAEPERFREAIDALTVKVAGDEFADGKVDSLSGRRGLLSGGTVRPSEPLSVTVVRTVRRRRFAGHVYNLQTVGGWYIANGIVVHNCRCHLEAVDVSAGVLV